MIEILRGLRLILSPADKWRMLGLVGLLTFGALLEIAGLGLLLPVVAAFTKPELFEQNRFLHLFRSLFAGAGETAFLLICCLLITLVYAGVTPPVGGVLFITMGIARAKMKDVMPYLMPYLTAVVICLLMFIFVPQLALWIPNLLFH